MKNFAINWFDFAVVIVIMLGVVRGRKHGMSAELLRLLTWLTTVVVAANFYKVIGDAVGQTTVFSKLSCYIAAYLLLVLLVKLVFLLIQKMMGGKLVGSDLFGRMEYYLGMASGAIRWVCMLMVALAVLHAPLYTDAQIKAKKKKQQDIYGSTFFPSFAATQSAIFKESFLGPLIERHLGHMLIEAVAPGASNLRESGPARRGERQLEEIMKK